MNNGICVGQVFTRLTILSPAPSLGNGRRWVCRCECGKEVVVTSSALNRPNGTRSCGCFKMDLMTKHGGSYSREYRCWDSMIRRCHGPSSEKREYYKGRGIQVCERWRDFANFIRDMGVAPSDKHTIDRLDGDKDYQPDNCRWATPKEQARNRRDNTLLTYDGMTLCAKEWSEVMGVGYGTLLNRIKMGWTVEQILLTPTRVYRRQNV